MRLLFIHSDHLEFEAPETAGPEGLVIGGRVGSSRSEPPQEAVLH